MTGSIPSDWSSSTHDNHIKTAIDNWNTNLGLQFVVEEVSAGSADIEIEFVTDFIQWQNKTKHYTNVHGACGYDFDGVGNTTKAKIYINAADGDHGEDGWNDETRDCPNINTEADLTSVLVHEIGHALGLGHGVEGQENCSVMTPSLDWGDCDSREPKNLDVRTINCLYDCELSWGELKGMYVDSYGVLSSAVALSSIANTLVWRHPPGIVDSTYYVYRAGEGAADLTLIGTVENGDSMFVDYAADPDTVYDYQCAAVGADTLIDLGTASAGLKLLSELSWDHTDLTEAIEVRDDYAYIAGWHYIKKIDISDPHNPVEVTENTNMPNLVQQVALSGDGTKLYVLSYRGLRVLDATAPGLALIGSIGLVSGILDEKVHDLVVRDDLIFVTAGTKGLLAIEIFSGSPTIRETYYGGAVGERAFVSVECRDDLVYTLSYSLPDWTFRSEILRVTEIGQSVVFDVVCRSDDPSCWTPGMALTSINDGHCKDFLTVGQLNGMYHVINAIVPEQPEPMLAFESGFTAPALVLENELGEMDTLQYFPNFTSFDLDSRYLYASVPMWGDSFGRGVFAFDLWGESSIATLATGDLLGDNMGAAVRSQGRYLYVWDTHDTTPGEPTSDYEERFRIYEKASGCEPHPTTPVRVFPGDLNYNVGEEIGVAWLVGCPTSVNVELLEDGSPAELVHSAVYPVADDVARSAKWEVHDFSANTENRVYQFRVTAGYDGGGQSSFESEPFSIGFGNVLEVNASGGATYTTIQAAIDAAQSGDTVVVHSGNYVENLTLRSNIHVFEADGEGVAITPANGGAAITASGLAHSPTISGFYVQPLPGVTATGLVVSGCEVNVEDCTFMACSAAIGGAVQITQGAANFRNTTFKENDATFGGGGAVYIGANAPSGAASSFENCEFTNNSASQAGGAVAMAVASAYDPQSAQVTFTNCRFIGNSAPDGGAILVGNFTRPEFDSCVFAKNDVTGSAGSNAIVRGTDAGALFRSCTFAVNTGTEPFDVLGIDGFSELEYPVTVDHSIIAGNDDGEAIAAVSASEYQVLVSNFHGNHENDDVWLGGASGNIGTPPGFCDVPSDDYQLQVFSPCLAGVADPVQIGAYGLGCVVNPDVISQVTKTDGTLRGMPEFYAFGCPQADGDTMIIAVSFDTTDVVTPPPAANAMTLGQISTGGTIALFTTASEIAADSVLGLVDDQYRTTFTVSSFGGYGDDSVAVYVYGVIVGYAQLEVRSPDFHLMVPPNEPGLVSLGDFGEFGSHFPSSVCNCVPENTAPYSQWSDYLVSVDPHKVLRDTTVTLADFGAFGEHLNHTYTAAGGGSGSSLVVSSSRIVLQLEESDPLMGQRVLRASVLLEDMSPYKVVLLSFKNENDILKYSRWVPDDNYAGSTMCTELVRDGQREIMLGCVGGGRSSLGGSLRIGHFELDVDSSEPLDLTEEDLRPVVAEFLTKSDQRTAFGGITYGRTFAPMQYHNALAQNYPNPFNPTTTIAFSLAQMSRVELKLYNVRGQVVRTLIDDARPAGNHRLVWDGRNNQGQGVASGVYFYRLRAGGFSATKKMVLLR